jgi:hypothetical protein
MLIFSIGVVVAGVALFFWQVGLRSIIAHQCIRNAIAWIRAESWDLLIMFTTFPGLKWRFYQRRYMTLVGLEVRKKLNTSDVDLYLKKVGQDQVLRLHAERLSGKGSKELEEYLITQYQNDTTLLSPVNAIYLVLVSTIGFAIALTTVAYGVAQLQR